MSANVMDDELGLLFKYPLMTITRENRNVVLVQGKMFVNTKDIYLKIAQIFFQGQYRYELIKMQNVSPVLAVQEVHAVLKKNPPSILIMLDQIYDVVRTRAIVERQLLPADGRSDIYQDVLHEISEFLQFYTLVKVQIDQKSNLLHIEHADVRGQEHSVAIAFFYSTEKYNEILFKISSCDLPIKESTKSHSTSLIELFDKLLADIEQLEPYIQLMNSIDASATVVDPIPVTKRLPYRRIYISDTISVLVVINPLDVYERPEIKFLGPPGQVEKHNSLLNENLAKWSCSKNILESILNLIGYEHFPAIDTPTIQEDIIKETRTCSICLTEKCPSQDVLPDITCDKENCVAWYHKFCLYSYLEASGARRVFEELVDLCPNCSNPISCPVIEIY
ncbi:hypothetical protein ABEB36_006792 [Hypothenemus hampei]|uniref:E3 ubiquitin-protein ligase FANCL n=1 Tax=Hypothenemus hampei TaxID=57062 RepID=A0ABD1ERS9_HYPHA